MSRQINGVAIEHLERQLLVAIKDKLLDLRALLNEATSHWGYEDYVYRFYHQSWKVFTVQRATLQIVAALRALLPSVPFNESFEQIVAAGTGKEFTSETNNTWDATTRPLIEAFFHARFFLEMAVKYGEELDEPPQVLPSGWAALLYLYNLR